MVNEDVICDKLRLNQILLNLLSNAMKFKKPGGMVSLRIIQTKEISRDYAGYAFRVKDIGISMNPEFQTHVFEAFTWEQTSAVSGMEGTGLGMAITKSIVDIMGGTISVHSEVGKGTEFIVRLRLRISGSPIKYEVIPELRWMRTLVADDAPHLYEWSRSVIFKFCGFYGMDTLCKGVRRITFQQNNFWKRNGVTDGRCS